MSKADAEPKTVEPPGTEIHFPLATMATHMGKILMIVIFASICFSFFQQSSANDFEKRDTPSGTCFQMQGFFVYVISAFSASMGIGSCTTAAPSIGDLYLNWDFILLTERVRDSSYHCALFPVPPGINIIGPSGADPLINTTGNPAPLLSYIALNSSETTGPPQVVYELPVPGVNITHYIFRYLDISGCQIQTNISLSNESYSYIYSNDTTDTDGVLMMVKYMANAFKVSYKISNYPFVQPFGSSISLIANITLGITSNSIISWGGDDTGTRMIVNMTSATDGTLVFELDAFSAMDGIPSGKPTHIANGTLSLEETTQVSFIYGLNACRNNSWTELFWDPQFTMTDLFSAPISPPSNNPNSPLAKSRTGLIVGVVLACACVVAIIASVILLHIFYEPFRHFFTPSTRQD